MNQDGCTGSFEAAIHTEEVHTLLLIQTIHVKYAFTRVKRTPFYYCSNWHQPVLWTIIWEYTYARSTVINEVYNY
jgi:hypothetical protein